MSKLKELIEEYIESQENWFEIDSHEKIHDDVLFSVFTSSELITEEYLIDEFSDIFDLKKKDWNKIHRIFKEENELVVNRYDFSIEEISFSFYELIVSGSEELKYTELKIEEEDESLIYDFFSYNKLYKTF